MEKRKLLAFLMGLLGIMWLPACTTTTTTTTSQQFKTSLERIKNSPRIGYTDIYISYALQRNGEVRPSYIYTLVPLAKAIQEWKNKPIVHLNTLQPVFDTRPIKNCARSAAGGWKYRDKKECLPNKFLFRKAKTRKGVSAAINLIHPFMALAQGGVVSYDVYFDREAFNSQVIPKLRPYQKIIPVIDQEVALYREIKKELSQTRGLKNIIAVLKKYGYEVHYEIKQEKAQTTQGQCSEFKRKKRAIAMEVLLNQVPGTILPFRPNFLATLDQDEIKKKFREQLVDRILYSIFRAQELFRECVPIPGVFGNCYHYDGLKRTFEIAWGEDCGMSKIKIVVSLREG